MSLRKVLEVVAGSEQFDVLLFVGLVLPGAMGKQGPLHAMLHVHAQDHTSRQVFKFGEVRKLMLRQKTNR